MPTYVYQVILEDPEEGEEGQIFEWTQKMSDPPLTQHPTTRQPVRRIIQAPHLVTQHSSASDKRKTSDSTLERNGFTKYVKTGDGTYEKTLGSGPKSLDAADPP
jgi:predicted nucleic acid-binding Zn ribbon protein